MDAFALILSLPAFCLLLFVALPSGWANQRPAVVRRAVTFLAGLQFVLAFSAAVLRLWWGTASGSGVLIEVAEGSGLNPSIYYDGTSSLMFLLVGFIGWIICRYSVRYLDGDDHQGRHFRWAAVTIGAVGLMAISGNLLMFACAWVLTSFGLHHLLLHFPERPAAQRAAWTKFTVSRMGDVALLVALILTYQNFKTLDLPELFAALSQLGESTDQPLALPVIGWLLVTAAALKSAQFPFHSWLPLTMETPTPVSALMHAGIVNAGGYLLIRTSPLIVHSPAALHVLAVVGTVTAVFGGVVMMTQSSVKQALAYSTIAQMGFMMLQCGLGAFTAAMLHLIAHSLYKAHAFLGSGSVMTQSQAMKGGKFAVPSLPLRSLAFSGAVAATILVYLVLLGLFGSTLTSKPGAFVFSFTLCLALITWGWQVLSLGTRPTLIAGLVGVGSLFLLYVASYLAIDAVLAGSVPKIGLPTTALILNGFIAVAFCTLFGLRMLIARQQVPRWLAALRVHAASGFYVDAASRRVLETLTS
jgi:NAD(P)H-quinone oxidoreductase subunit 5